MIKQAELAGYLNLTGQKVSFLVPVFSAGGELFSQVTSDDDTIKSFEPMSDLMRRFLIEASEPKTLRSGDAAFFAFQLPDGTIVAGTKRELARSLRARRRSLAEFPFVCLAVAKFTNDVSFGRAQVFKSAQQIERKNRQIGQKWLETELLGLEPDMQSTNRIVFTRDKNQREMFSEIEGRLRNGFDVYVRLQLVRSSAGLKPKVRGILCSLQLEDARIGTETRFLPVAAETLQNLKQVSDRVRITEVIELPKLRQARASSMA